MMTAMLTATTTTTSGGGSGGGGGGGCDGIVDSTGDAIRLVNFAMS
jgi:hypothetical protein